jgi:hypothetical protein
MKEKAETKIYRSPYTGQVRWSRPSPHIPIHKMKNKTLTEIVRSYVVRFPLNEFFFTWEDVAEDLASACAAAYEAGRTPGAQPLSQTCRERLVREGVAALDDCPKEA